MSETITNKTSQVQRPSMWTVVFLNDDYTPMAFVEQVLISIYHKSPDEARHITLTIHLEGHAKVGHYTREVAFHKAEQTMLVASIVQHPLQVCPERI